MEILNNRVRRELASNKCDADIWICIMGEAHEQGLKTTATMMFGHIESLEERLEHLERVRNLQDSTGGFTAFILWPFQPDNTPLAASRHIEKTSAVHY